MLWWQILLIGLASLTMTGIITLIVKIIFDWLKNKKNGKNSLFKNVICPIDLSGTNKSIEEIRTVVNSNQLKMQSLANNLDVGVEAAKQDIVLYGKLQETANNSMVIQKQMLQEMKSMNMNLKEHKQEAMLNVLKDISNSLRK